MKGSNWAKDKFPGISYEEELEFYDEILERVIKDPRYYLQNLEDLEVFRFSFIEFKKEKVYK